MIEIIRQFVVKQEARGQFELAYGPGSSWSKLFARSPGFRGTTVLHDAEDPRRYLTIEIWNSAAEREQALTTQRAEHDVREASFSEWTESEVELGTLRVVAEATVRPRGRAGLGKRPSSGRRGR